MHSEVKVINRINRIPTAGGSSPSSSSGMAAASRQVPGWTEAGDACRMCIIPVIRGREEEVYPIPESGTKLGEQMKVSEREREIPRAILRKAGTLGTVRER